MISASLLGLLLLSIGESPLARRRFGVSSHDPAATIAATPRLQTAFQVARMGLLWEGVERSPGIYDFARWDAWFASAPANATGSYLILCYGNSLHTGGAAIAPATPSAISAFVRFALAAMRRYRGRGVVWELWNEPNGHQFWPGGPNASAYAALALALGREMRAEPALRGEVLVGPAASQVDIPFIAAVQRAGGLRYMDAVSVHPYCFGGPEQRRASYSELRRVTGSLPIIAGEWGWSTCTNAATGAPARCVGGATADDNPVADQAAFLVRQYLVDAMEEVPISVWYDWADGSNTTLGEQSFGVIHADGQPKPAFLAAQTLERLLGSRAFVGRIDTGAADANTSFVLNFSRGSDGRPDAIASVIAVWSIDRSDGVSTVVGTGHEMVCRGKIRSGPMRNCSDACRRTPLCRAFVSW